MDSKSNIINSCTTLYESLMESTFESAQSAEELENAHQKAKDKVIQKYTGSQDMPEDLIQEIQTSLESTYAQLREYKDLPQKTQEKPEIMIKRSLRPMESVHDIAIGVDLGTTMCCVAVFREGKVEIIPNKAQGNVSTTPSYVLFKDDGSYDYGNVAKQRAYRFPETTIYDAKRMIGRSWDDENLQNDRKVWPFTLINDNGTPKIRIGQKDRYPHEVSARLLSRFRRMAEEYLELPYGSISKAVVTVPAYFTEPQRRATEEAAACAGLQVLNILSEPSAAAIAYSYERREAGTRTALIYDLGGGTFDVAIAKVKLNDVEILGVDGDTHLGGQDFDQLLVDYCIQEFETSEGIDLLEHKESSDKKLRDSCKRALSRVKQQCEIAKEQLSSAQEFIVEVNEICEGKSMEIFLSRQILEDLVKPVIRKTIDIVERAIREARNKGIKGVRDIDDVILVGGSTRMPLVVEMVQDCFDYKELCQYINPDEAVAYGAAVQAAILNKHKGVEQYLNVGDVLPMSIGIEADEEKFSAIIPRNTRIPCEYSKTYATRTDSQTRLKFTVYQGEKYWSKDNKWLGEFLLEGIRPRKKGAEKALVTMTVDFKGILHVSAVSLTDKENQNAIKITSEKLGMDVETIKQLSEKLRPRPPAMVEDE